MNKTKAFQLRGKTISVPKAYEYIRSRLGREELLAGLAEESAELSQAALKLRRTVNGANPTPISTDQAEEHLIEEIADVFVLLKMLGYDRDEEKRRIAAIRETKTARWLQRLTDTEEKDNA